MDRSKFDEMMAKSAKKEEEVVANSGMQIGFDVVEVQRVGLQPGDVLMVTVKNDELSQESVDALRYQLQQVLPNNKVFILAMGTSDDVQFSIVSQSENPVASCSGVGYCNDCSCGNKEQVLTKENKPSIPGGSNAG